MFDIQNYARAAREVFQSPSGPEARDDSFAALSLFALSALALHRGLSGSPNAEAEIFIPASAIMAAMAGNPVYHLVRRFRRKLLTPIEP